MATRISAKIWIFSKFKLNLCKNLPMSTKSFSWSDKNKKNLKGWGNKYNIFFILVVVWYQHGPGAERYSPLWLLWLTVCESVIKAHWLLEALPQLTDKMDPKYIIALEPSECWRNACQKKMPQSVILQPLLRIKSGTPYIFFIVGTNREVFIPQSCRWWRGPRFECLSGYC